MEELSATVLVMSLTNGEAVVTKASWSGRAAMGIVAMDLLVRVALNGPSIDLNEHVAAEISTASLSDKMKRKAFKHLLPTVFALLTACTGDCASTTPAGPSPESSVQGKQALAHEGTERKIGKRMIQCSDCSAANCATAVEELRDGVWQVDRAQWQKRSHCLGVHADWQLLPNLENGKPTGMKVVSPRRGGMFYDVGLRDGDIIRTINGGMSPGTLAQIHDAAAWDIVAVRGEKTFEVRLEFASKDL